MTKRLVIALIAAVLLIGCLAAFKTVEPKAIETISFYNEMVEEVVGCEPVAPAEWQLSEGRYEVVFYDGTSSLIEVANGAWRYIQ